MRRPLPLPLFLLGLLLAAGRCARGDTFDDPANQFSLEIPDGWTPLAPGEVQAATAQLSPDPELSCFAGFARGDQGVLLLSAEPYPDGQTFDALTMPQVQRLAAALTGVNAAEFHAATRPAVSPMAADTSRQITCFPEPPGFAIDYQDAARAQRSHSVAFLGKTHVVMLHFFMQPVDYPFIERSMDEIALSFQFHTGEAPGLKTTFTAPDDYTTWGLYGFVALQLLAAGYLLRYLFKRKEY